GNRIERLVETTVDQGGANGATFGTGPGVEDASLGSRMSAYLEVVEGPDAGRQIPLDREVTIGRDESADVALSDPHASRRHCSVALTNGSAVVKDLESS